MDEKLPEWEAKLIDEAIALAQRRHQDEKERADNRALQLAREQGYHRLAVEIDRPSKKKAGPGQLSFFPTPTLFDQDA